MIWAFCPDPLLPRASNRGFSVTGQAEKGVDHGAVYTQGRGAVGLARCIAAPVSDYS